MAAGNSVSTYWAAATGSLSLGFVDFTKVSVNRRVRLRSDGHGLEDGVEFRESS